MVKTHFLFLVLLHVALTLVSCESSDEKRAPAESKARSHRSSEETTTMKPREKRKRTTTMVPEPAPMTCEEALQAERDDCLNNIPEGYQPGGCKFSITTEQCDWTCVCEETITEAPTTEEPSTTKAPQSDSESSESNQKESCETEKEINFKNCFFDIQGFIRRKFKKCK